MKFEEWWGSFEQDGYQDSDMTDFKIAQEAWDAGYHQAIQDIIDYAEHMGDVEKFARQHGIRVEEE